MPRPRIEDLYRIGTGIDLCDQMCGDRACELREQLTRDFVLVVKVPLGRREVLRASTFDQVTRERKRRAGESEQRRRRPLLLHHPDRIVNEAHRLDWIG